MKNVLDTVHTREQAALAAQKQSFPIIFRRMADNRPASASDPEGLDRALQYLFSEGSTQVCLMKAA